MELWIVAYVSAGLATSVACYPWSDKTINVLVTKEHVYTLAGKTVSLILFTVFWPMIVMLLIGAGVIEWRDELNRFRERRDRYNHLT